MLVPRQEYSRELKVACMRELDSGKGMAEVARQYQISPKRLETWKGEWRAKGELAFPGKGARPQARLDSERVAVLERKIGQQAMEIDFLKKKSCGVSRSIPWEPAPMAAPHLRANPGSGRSGGRRESTLPDHRSEQRQIIPFSAVMNPGKRA
jgi:transposase